MATREISVRELVKVKPFHADWSIEIVPTDRDPIEPAIAVVPKASCIYVASIPGRKAASIIEASAQLRRAGFEPIPHITARGVKDLFQLNDVLARLRGEADVEKLMLLGGDVDDIDVGVFPSSRAALETGLFRHHGFKAIGFATYAEPHARIPRHVLESELASKVELASHQGHSSWLVSQLCFDPDLIINHARALRSSGIITPLHVGMAGPTSWQAIARFAIVCGVSASARSLTTQGSRIKRLLVGYEPSQILHRLARAAADNPSLGFVKPHFFSFGGAAKTASWVNSFFEANQDNQDGR